MSKFESFIERKNITVGLRTLVIGIGQAGSNIADVFAALNTRADKKVYDVFTVNSTSSDSMALKNVQKDNRLLLKGFEKGFGRDTGKALQAFNSKENRDMILSTFHPILKAYDCVMVISGLGGGTGTGCVIPMVSIIDKLMNDPIRKANAVAERAADKRDLNPILCMVTIPRINDSLQEKGNALKACNALEDYKEKGVLSGVIYIDNEKGYQDFKTDSEGFDTWLEKTNFEAVSLYHEVNVLTTFASSKMVDQQDFLNVLSRNPGAVVFSKCKLDVSDIGSPTEVIRLVNGSIDNVVASGYDMNRSKHMIGIILAPERKNLSALCDAIMDGMDSPLLISKKMGYTTWASDRSVIIYTVQKVTGLPQRLVNSLKEEFEKAAAGISSERPVARKDFSVDLSVIGFDVVETVAVPSNPKEEDKELSWDELDLDFLK